MKFNRPRKGVYVSTDGRYTIVRGLDHWAPIYEHDGEKEYAHHFTRLRDAKTECIRHSERRQLAEA